ncbi:hypothetical protein NX059_000126 [Plenodomus lindquistii]|nr:hypothetical protein NX059_000126 [Plenodomus lindquistii]
MVSHSRVGMGTVGGGACGHDAKQGKKAVPAAQSVLQKIPLPLPRPNHTFHNQKWKCIDRAATKGRSCNQLCSHFMCQYTAPTVRGMEGDMMFSRGILTIMIAILISSTISTHGPSDSGSSLSQQKARLEPTEKPIT